MPIVRKVSMNRFDSLGMADCVVPLDDEQREALHEFWDRVIVDELGPEPTERPAPVDAALIELAERQRRRTARRALVRVARAARAIQAVEAAPGFGGEAA